MQNILDIFYPKTCSICHRKGEYLCGICKKLFKRNLPECYLCRRISSNYKTHNICKNSFSLDYVFVCWKYDSLSSNILKRYKYKYVYTVSDIICDFLLESILSSSLKDILGNTLLVNVPISSSRLSERGFNQTYDITSALSKIFSIPFYSDLLGRKNTFEHQSLKDKGERRYIDQDDFFILNPPKTCKFDSITIIDDVLTTGSTLEAISKVLKRHYKESISVNALCLFRGRPYYSLKNSGSSDC